MAMLDEALKYAHFGMAVFPCKMREKTPLTTHGHQDASKNEEVIKAWWAKWPEANIGIRCGEASNGLVVLDVDGEQGSESTKDKHLPATPISVTGNDGYHYFFHSAIAMRPKIGLLPHVDIRAEDSYVIAPPSIHPNGKEYTWAIAPGEVPFAEAPDWIINNGHEASPTISEPIIKTKRNATLASLGGSLRRRGLPPATILTTLLAVNTAQCQPPLDEAEVKKIAASVSRYSPDPLASLDTENTETTEQSDTTETTEAVEIVEATDTFEKNRTATELLKTDKVVWPMVANWLLTHQGERFDLDTICRHIDVKTRDSRQSVAKKLAYEVNHQKLEKSVNFRPPLYRVIDHSIIRMNWLGARSSSSPLQWPRGRDETTFGFDGRVEIPEKGLIVIAGVTNVGKSVFCRNFLWANMDIQPCFYFSSETSESDFADYASRMTWAEPVDLDGKPKFDLIWRNKDWHDVIQPDAINIIDWLNLGDSFYQIGTVLEGIKNRLNKGIALIAIQKDPTKELGMGGMWSQHLSSLYLTMDYGRMTVKKAKKWHTWNPNGKTFGFDIMDRGTHFSDICLLKKCSCWQGKKGGVECKECKGTGFVPDA